MDSITKANIIIKKISVEEERSYNFKERWGDVVKWSTFWEELEEVLLTRTRLAWFSGYRSGLRERKR